MLHGSAPVVRAGEEDVNSIKEYNTQVAIEYHGDHSMRVMEYRRAGIDSCVMNQQQGCKKCLLFEDSRNTQTKEEIQHVAAATTPQYIASPV